MCGDDGKHDSEENPGKPDQNSHGRSIAYRVAEFGLYAIFVSGDIFEWWKDHRIVALVIAVAALGFLLVIDKGFSARTIARTLVGASLMAIAAYFFVPITGSPEVEVIGYLQPRNDPTPPNGCDGAKLPANALKILIGTSGYVALPGQNKVTAIQIGKAPNSCDVLTLESTPRGVEVGATLYDEHENLIARIADNEFHALNGSHSHIERQHDLGTLIVKDGSGNELLYIRFLNPTTIRARGTFGCPGHRLVTFTDTGQIPGATVINSCMGGFGAAVHVD